MLPFYLCKNLNKVKLCPCGPVTFLLLKVKGIYSSSFLLHCSYISAAFYDIMLLIFAWFDVLSWLRLYLRKMYDGQKHGN